MGKLLAFIFVCIAVGSMLDGCSEDSSSTESPSFEYPSEYTSPETSTDDTSNPVTSTQAGMLEWAICSNLQEGMSRAEVADRMTVEMTYSQAQQLIDVAVTDMCPGAG